MPRVRTRLQADVEDLSSRNRGSASQGERAAAEWVVERLREAGAVDAAVEPAIGSGTYGWAFAAYAAAGFAAASGGWSGRGRTAGGSRSPSVLARIGRAKLALAALAAFELDGSGRWAPLRRVLPRGEGANAVARVPARGDAKAVVVLAAHIDTARTGLVWRSGLTKLGTRPGRMPPDGGAVAVAFVLAAAGALLGRRGRIPRALARVLLGVAVAANLDVATSPHVPGANDNASGVAGVLELVRGLAADPVPGVEVRVALVGSEESGMGGMRAWLETHGADLDPARTLVLGLDTIGSGTPIATTGEGIVRTHRYGEAELALADAGARRAGLRSAGPLAHRRLDRPDPGALRGAPGAVAAVGRRAGWLRGVPRAHRHPRPRGLRLRGAVRAAGAGRGGGVRGGVGVVAVSAGQRRDKGVCPGRPGAPFGNDACRLSPPQAD